MKKRAKKIVSCLIIFLLISIPIVIKGRERFSDNWIDKNRIPAILHYNDDTYYEISMKEIEIMKRKIKPIIIKVIVLATLSIIVISSVINNLLICNITFEMEGDQEYCHKPCHLYRNEGDWCPYFSIKKENGYIIVTPRAEWGWHPMEHYFTCNDDIFEIGDTYFECNTLLGCDDKKSKSIEIININYHLYNDSNGNLQCEVSGSGFSNAEAKISEYAPNNLKVISSEIIR